MRIESPNDDIPIHSLVEETLASEDFVSLLSCQSDAYCFQVVSIVEGVRFVNDLVGNLKAYNRTLIHPTDAISFTGVLHSVKSTTAFLEEDSYMRAVLECSGRNQLLVTTEAKKTNQREMKEATDKGLDVPDLEMIYHGNYLTMGPRMAECEVFRLVKQL